MKGLHSAHMRLKFGLSFTLFWVKVWSYVSPLLICTGCNVISCKTASYSECIVVVWHTLNACIDFCFMAAMSSHIWSVSNMWLLLQLWLWGYTYKLVCLVTMCTLHYQYVNNIQNLRENFIEIFWRILIWLQVNFTHVQNATVVSLIV